jgi:hypothetical protein
MHSSLLDGLDKVAAIDYTTEDVPFWLLQDNQLNTFSLSMAAQYSKGLVKLDKISTYLDRLYPSFLSNINLDLFLSDFDLLPPDTQLIYANWLLALCQAYPLESLKLVELASILDSRRSPRLLLNMLKAAQAYSDEMAIDLAKSCIQQVLDDQVPLTISLVYSSIQSKPLTLLFQELLCAFDQSAPNAFLDQIIHLDVFLVKLELRWSHCPRLL